MNEKKTKFFILLACVLCAGILANVIYFFVQMTQGVLNNSLGVFNPLSGNDTSGAIIVQVQDGWEKTPIEGASVVIPEIGFSCTTDINGHTQRIAIEPMQRDESDVLPKTWDEVTVLIYKAGYVESALFHVQIWSGQTRTGPVVYLFPITIGGNNLPFSLTEGPQRLWVSQLLDKYRP